MYDILLKHSDDLISKHNIKCAKDFDRIEIPLHNTSFYREIRKRLLGLPNIQSVQFEPSYHSAACCRFRFRLRVSPVWGLSVFVSKLAPFYFSIFETPEALTPIRTDLVSKGGLDAEPRWEEYLKSRNRRIPDRVKRMATKVHQELAGFGLIYVPHHEFSRNLGTANSTPKELHKFTFEFFYFHSIPLIRTGVE